MAEFKQANKIFLQFVKTMVKKKKKEALKWWVLIKSLGKKETDRKLVQGEEMRIVDICLSSFDKLQCEREERHSGQLSDSSVSLLFIHNL